MKGDGILQQIGRPKEVYDNPANTFVAQFIGSPVMNLLPCRYDGTDGGTTILVGDQHVDTFGLSNKLHAKLEAGGAASRPLTLGVRPEAVMVHREPVDGCIKVEVEGIEPLGPYDIVDLKVGDGVLRGSTRSRFIERTGDEAWVHLDEDRLHFFDTDTGASLGL